MIVPISSLKPGDRVQTKDGFITIVSCRREAIFEGNLYRVEADKGVELHDGGDRVRLITLS